MKSKSVDLGNAESEEKSPPPKRKETITLFTETAAPGEQEREFTIKDAEALLKYQKARGKELWKIKDGQPFTLNKDGSITSSNKGKASNVQE